MLEEGKVKSLKEIAEKERIDSSYPDFRNSTLILPISALVGFVSG